MVEDAQLTVICSLIASGNEKFLKVIIENVRPSLRFCTSSPSQQRDG